MWRCPLLVCCAHTLAPRTGSVRLMFDGERCEPDQTPLDLDMEDGDQLVRVLGR